jgi:hypothetical protein
MRKVVVNFASGRYAEGQQRLKQSLMATGYDGDFLFENLENNIPFTSHNKVNYGFKAAMIDKARCSGYELILWLDASVYAQKSIQPIFDYIEKEGYFILENTNNTGSWCADTALKPLEITREESFTIPHIFSGVFGLNVQKHTDVISEFYLMAVLRPGAFNGHKHNDRGIVSKDPRVFGHRHDQTVLSVLFWRHGIRKYIQQEERLTKWFSDWDSVYDTILKFKLI